MKAYLGTTGAVFALVTAMHVVRVFAEPHLVRDPWFVLATVIATALAVWAVRLLQKTARP